MDFNSWSCSQLIQIVNAILVLGLEGNIFGRDYTICNKYEFGLIKANMRTVISVCSV
jgi:hypothetical protein